MRLSRCALFVLSLSLCANLSRASNLYSLDSGGGTGTIYTLNQSTAAETLVGPVGAAFTFPGDLASDTSTANFRIWSPDINTKQLLKINPATGAGTVVGNFMTPAGGPVTIVSLAFDQTTGRLWGNTTDFYSGDHHLYSIDLNTAISTPVGPGLGFNEVYALAFNNAGKLYGVDHVTHQLLGIDTTLGIGTAIAPVAPQSIFDIATRPEDGVTFAVDAGPNQLYKLDLTTGGTTLVGTHTVPTHNMVGLAFGPAVPEPTSFTLLLIGATGALIRRKR